MHHEPRTGQRLRRVLRGLGPAIGPAARLDLLRAGLGSAMALLACAAFLLPPRVDLAGGLFLIAPLGASAVLLFAVPNSPLAQPWSALVGNVASAFVALAVMAAVDQPALAAGLCVGLAILAMLLLRALHPPGGAVALTAALNPDMVDAMGLWFVLGPVLFGTLALVLAAVAWHRLSGRVYPFRQPAAPGVHGTADRAPHERLGPTPEELAALLAEYRQSANLGVADLSRLIAAAETIAAGHALGDLTCADVMSRDLVTVGPGARVARAASLFRRHGFHSVPVVEGEDIYLGTIFQLDLIRRARRDALRLRHPFSSAMTQLRRDASNLTVRAEDVMSTGLATLAPESPAAALLPLLSDGGQEAVPILSGPRIVGIATRTDLISVLARSAAVAALDGASAAPVQKP